MLKNSDFIVRKYNIIFTQKLFIITPLMIYMNIKTYFNKISILNKKTLFTKKCLYEISYCMMFELIEISLILIPC